MRALKGLASADAQRVGRHEAGRHAVATRPPGEVAGADDQEHRDHRPGPGRAGLHAHRSFARGGSKPGRALPAVLTVLALLTAAGLLRPGLAQPVLAQPGSTQQEAETQIRHAFTLQHQRADDALEWMQSEMSPHGTIELQRATNTLVLRDRSSVLEHLLALLRDFDHPRRQIEFEIFILEASRRGSGDPRSELPAQLTDELGNWLAFTSYRLLGEGRFEATEGEDVRYEIGAEFRLGFRVGTVLLDRRLKLYGVEIERSRGGALDERVFNGHLNVWVGKPLVLALPYRGSDASGLVVAVTVRPPGNDALGAAD